MIPHQAKVTVLREDCSFVVHRAIFEVIDEAGGKLAASRTLHQITRREQLSIKGTQRQKAMHRTLWKAYRYRFREAGTCETEGGAKQPCKPRLTKRALDRHFGLGCRDGNSFDPTTRNF